MQIFLATKFIWKHINQNFEILRSFGEIFNQIWNYIIQMSKIKTKRNVPHLFFIFSFSPQSLLRRVNRFIRQVGFSRMFFKWNQILKIRNESNWTGARIQTAWTNHSNVTHRVTFWVQWSSTSWLFKQDSSYRFDRSVLEIDRDKFHLCPVSHLIFWC